MIIGDKHSFAVQFEVNPEPDSWLFGHICFVVKYSEVGDYLDETSLSTAVGYLMELLWYKGLREESKLFHLEKKELFWKIDKALYGDTEASIEECQDNWERFAKFHALSSGIDIFDNWKGYLIEHKDQGKLIIKNPSGEIQEDSLKAGELDSVLEEVVNFFEQNYSQYFIHWSKQ
ncbi:MAG: hypothetical protein DRR16_13300 [Candidatus Parabeggiatoa sp. nov. 3]|jgi:hypothetical protein|nr:MAG: hypothetical protein DRR00_00120 [Gammaproteobacteria bacterium]RKZ69577.1 MAG: hypothetical protein DRQ99_00665 [Gammaproteobacteria bacterium]RKZ84949.1 MAG: hypothetical protein DRR16_13300 [Gammaproteobacteria bacterium]HEW98751.1 hypothetical protein [Beggiatoa sp.]